MYVTVLLAKASYKVPASLQMLRDTVFIMPHRLHTGNACLTMKRYITFRCSLRYMKICTTLFM